jgi:hypothetical protein
MKITLLGVELDEEEVMKKVTSDAKPHQFNSEFFTEQLETYAEEVERYSTLGKEFKKEFIDASRIYKALVKIDEWFRLYNYTDTYPSDKIVKVSKLVHIKLYDDMSKRIIKNYDDVVNLDGLYTVFEMYIIPFSLVSSSKNKDETYLETLRRVSMDMCKPLSSDPDRVYNTYGLPDDASYGTSRVISPTHFAVIVESQDNPIASRVTRNVSWRYVSPSGYAV